MADIAENSVTGLENFASLVSNKARGLKELDKSHFNVSITLSAVKCKARTCGKFLAVYKDVLFKRPHFKKIINDPVTGSEHRLMLLDPSIRSVDDLNETQKTVIIDENGEFCNEISLPITYEDFTFNEAVQCIIPEDAETVTAFETVGHIAHVNLKEHLHDFKFVIGQILLDKNVHIKTVVNKMNSINATFRFFEMELLAGEDKMVASVNEHGCLFIFDYSKVYWNSRLQSEHKRLVDLISPGDNVFDVFAGVGPFAVPAGKKNCNVFANDLNPSSYESLMHNGKLNKVTHNIKAFNLDGREFLEKIVIDEHLSNSHKDDGKHTHIVMNLPAIAPEFLDVFKNRYEARNESKRSESNISVHCYCFSKSETPEADAEENIRGILGVDELSNVNTHLVRRVAPHKVMLCVSFNLSWFEDGCVADMDTGAEDEVLSRKRVLDDDANAGQTKRLAYELTVDEY